MRTAKISSENQALDTAQWENIQNLINDTRTANAGDEVALQKIDQSEKFIMAMLMGHLHEQAAGAETRQGATTSSIDRETYSPAGVAGLPRRSNFNSSGQPLPPT